MAQNDRNLFSLGPRGTGCQKSGLLLEILGYWLTVAKLQSLPLLRVSQMSLSFPLGRTVILGFRVPPKSRMISPQDCKLNHIHKGPATELSGSQRDEGT